ncbi:MAG: hypothetical protein WC810_27990 [Janthinobacterium sp.]|jgi:hypothetical protein
MKNHGPRAVVETASVSEKPNVSHAETISNSAKILATTAIHELLCDSFPEVLVESKYEVLSFQISNDMVLGFEAKVLFEADENDQYRLVHFYKDECVSKPVFLKDQLIPHDHECWGSTAAYEAFDAVKFGSRGGAK